MHQLRDVEGNPRADHDQVLIAKSALAVLSGFDADAVIEQHRNLIAQLLGRLGVGHGDGCAAFGKKQSAGHAGFPQPYHQRALSLNFHYRESLL
jgi:hypothetical protein